MPHNKVAACQAARRGLRWAASSPPFARAAADGCYGRLPRLAPAAAARGPLPTRCRWPCCTGAGARRGTSWPSRPRLTCRSKYPCSCAPSAARGPPVTADTTATAARTAAARASTRTENERCFMRPITRKKRRMNIDARSAGPPSFSFTPKPNELQQLRALSAPKCHWHRRFCEMALPVICLSACVPL